MKKASTNKTTSLTKVDVVKFDKINVFFKRSILKSVVKILVMEHSGFRTFKSIKNINRLFANIDIDKYKHSKELESYIWCITYVSRQWLDGIVNIDLIHEGIKRHAEYDNIKDDIITSCMNDPNIITAPEAKMIFDLVGEALQFGFVTAMKEEYINLLDDVSLDTPGSFRQLVERLFLVSQSLLDIKHNTNMVAQKVTFNTADVDSLKEAISQTIESLSTSNNIFKMGIRRLNTLLSPGYMNGRIYVYLGLPGSGKAQPDDTPIPTPTGFKRMDELKLGDKVFNLHGKPVDVIGIFPQGTQDTYKVTFTDGRSTRCNADHLWYTLAKHGQTGEFRAVVRKLSEMMDDYERGYPSCPDKKHHKYIIPNNGVAQFESQDIPIDPWVLGYLIGNGCCLESQFKVSAPDDEAVLKIADSLGFIPERDHLSNYTYFFRKNRGDKNRIKSKDIIGNISEIFKKYSHEKRIPKKYIFNTEKVRMSLLTGLMDSDGCISKSESNRKYPKFTLSYSTTSSELVEDISVLLESLGFGYHVSPTRKQEGKRDQYSISINIPNNKMPSIFSVRRKYNLALEAWSYRDQRNYEHIRICNIEKVESTSQRCIMVDDPLHVYLTEQFIPTHNSLMLLKSALDIRKYNPDFKPRTPGMKPCVLYITMENTFTETIERIWNMNFDDSIANYSPDEALEKIMKELGIGKVYKEAVSYKDLETGEEKFSDLLDKEENNAPNIEVVLNYFSYREISTGDIFTIIQDLREENLEVCAFVFDYIKRIRPETPAADNVKLELNRVINELKALAVIQDIPVITAHQMNRAAASTVDSAARQGKGDVTKLVGRENVGDSWEVIETADWAGVLNIEYKPMTDDKYMVVNVVKRRRIDSGEGDFAKYTYLAHPFARNNGLRLLDDIHIDKVLSLQSLSTDIDIVGKDKVNAVPRLKTMEHKEFIEVDGDYDDDI